MFLVRIEGPDEGTFGIRWAGMGTPMPTAPATLLHQPLSLFDVWHLACDVGGVTVCRLRRLNGAMLSTVLHCRKCGARVVFPTARSIGYLLRLCRRQPYWRVLVRNCPETKGWDDIIRAKDPVR